jgi:hypothetical protein
MGFIVEINALTEEPTPNGIAFWRGAGGLLSQYDVNVSVHAACDAFDARPIAKPNAKSNGRNCPLGLRREDTAQPSDIRTTYRY